MKKTIYLLSIALILLSQSVFADHVTQQRNKCAALKKYRAHAKLKKYGQGWQNNYDNGCTYAQAGVWASTFCSCSCPYQTYSECGHSEVYIGNGGFWTYNWTQAGWGAYGFNNDPYPATESFVPMIKKVPGTQQKDATTTTEGTISDNFSSEEIQFDVDNHRIVIPNLTGTLHINSDDMANDFVTIVFKIFEEEIVNGESNPLQTIWTAQASIINGELVLEGFDPTDFDGNSHAGFAEYTLNPKTLTIDIPAAIDLDNVVVEISGDDGNFGMGSFVGIIPQVSKLPQGAEIISKMQLSAAFNFEVSNNTSSKQLNVNISKNTLNMQPKEATIMTLDGRVVKTTVVDLNANKQVFDISDLAAGVYLLNYQIGDRIYSRKFIN